VQACYYYDGHYLHLINSTPSPKPYEHSHNQIKDEITTQLHHNQRSKNWASLVKIPTLLKIFYAIEILAKQTLISIQPFELRAPSNSLLISHQTQILFRL
jgi:hypothetical protein